jgi:hypothetical protein
MMKRCYAPTGALAGLQYEGQGLSDSSRTSSSLPLAFAKASQRCTHLDLFSTPEKERNLFSNRTLFACYRTLNMSSISYTRKPPFLSYMLSRECRMNDSPPTVPQPKQYLNNRKYEKNSTSRKHRPTRKHLPLRQHQYLFTAQTKHHPNQHQPSR